MIDTHAHLYACTPTVSTLIQRAKDNGVTHIVNVAVDIKTGIKSREMAEINPELIPTIGLHPSESPGISDVNAMEEELDSGLYHAIGEIGLDYFKNYHPRDIQIRAFETQLALAAKYNLPVIIHNRHADEDVIAILRDFPTIKKVFHCFASGPDFVETTLSDNSFYSFTGMITFAKKGKTIRAISAIPMSQIMLETDCPYLTPITQKGVENEPAFVTEVAKKIADIKTLSVDEVATQTSKTAASFFNITA